MDIIFAIVIIAMAFGIIDLAIKHNRLKDEVDNHDSDIKRAITMEINDIREDLSDLHVKSISQEREIDELRHLKRSIAQETSERIDNTSRAFRCIALVEKRVRLIEENIQINKFVSNQGLSESDQKKILDIILKYATSESQK